jgi:alpha-tubulin suppressor-like RCC1 family protein
LDISSGLNHMLALTTKGEVYSWGYNATGIVVILELMKKVNLEQEIKKSKICQ